jgi:hypothetical protein
MLEDVVESPCCDGALDVVVARSEEVVGVVCSSPSPDELEGVVAGSTSRPTDAC